LKNQSKAQVEEKPAEKNQTAIVEKTNNQTLSVDAKNKTEKAPKVNLDDVHGSDEAPPEEKKTDDVKVINIW